MMEAFSPLSGGAFVYYLQQWLKRRHAYAWFVQACPGADKWAHRCVAGVLSLLIGMGISIVFEGDWTHGWKFSGTVPPGWTLLEGVWHSLEVFAVGQFAYDATGATRVTPLPPLPPTGKE